MRILEINGYKVYIYYNDCKQHNLPHCHVRYKDEKEWVLLLPTLDVIIGGKLKKKIKNYLADNLDYLCNKWDELNPDC